jgi:trigger factor
MEPLAMTDETPTTAPETAADAPDAAQEAGETFTTEAGQEPPAEGEEKKAEKLVQTVEMQDIGPCKKHVKVTVERASIDNRLNEKFSELVKDSSVPGFRRGKAPRRFIERQFHKQVGDQVRNEVLMASLEQLGEENDIAPLTQPDLHPESIEIPKEGPLIYEFDVEVRPQFDLPNYKGLQLKRPIRTFNENDVDREVKRLISPHGQLVPKDGVAELEDYVIADLTIRDGDRVVGSANEISLRLEPQLAFRDGVAERFGDQVVGARAGETRTIDITLSDRAADPTLRGKKVPGTLEVKDVKRMRLPELTHEFLHQFGVHSEPQFREQVARLLEMRLEYQQRQAARKQVLDQIAAASTWELPQDLLQRQARRAMGRRLMEMREAGMSDEEIRGQQRLLQQDVLRSTAQALKEHFVLQKIAEVEKIDIKEEEVDAAIEALAGRSNESPRRVRARLEKDELLEPLAIEIIERKVLDLILENATFEDMPVGHPAEDTIATVEHQAVAGEMHDPTEVKDQKSEVTGQSSEVSSQSS